MRLALTITVVSGWRYFLDDGARNEIPRTQGGASDQRSEKQRKLQLVEQNTEEGKARQRKKRRFLPRGLFLFKF